VAEKTQAVFPVDRVKPLSPSLMTRHFFELALLAALALSSLNSKAIGLAWVLLILAGVWEWLQKHRGLNANESETWLKAWLGIALAALIIKTIPMVYWTDPWGERHGELRLFLGALALYALAKWQGLKRETLSGIAYALSISSAAGLIWVVLYGRANLSTHPIPWAGSMAMTSALLLAVSLKTDFEVKHRRIWFAGGLFALMAVLSSESRGAFGIVLWWLVVCGHHAVARKKNAVQAPVNSGKAPKRRALIVIAFLLGLALISQSPVFKRPIESIKQAATEISVSQQSVEKGANSSVGARIYLWQQSWIAIQDSPWIGYGHDGRKEKLTQWAAMSGSTTIKNLGHVHNEYLHQLIDHGLLGLLSQLCYIFGLIWLSWTLHKRHQTASAVAIAGICFVHLSASMSNVNFAHNQYTTSLSVLIGISLWLSTLRPR
jgi:O-antigen ligase